MNNFKTLLPDNSSNLEYELEKTMERAFSLKTEEIAKIWTPDQCPVHFLPWLAWAFSVDEWDSSWPEETKREVIKSSIYIHRHKGTLAAVKRALFLAGVDGELVEWFEEGGSGIPKTFNLTILDNQANILNREGQKTLFKLIDQAKPVSVQRKIVIKSTEGLLNPVFGRRLLAISDGYDKREGRNDNQLSNYLNFGLRPDTFSHLVNIQLGERGVLRCDNDHGQFDCLTLNHQELVQGFLNKLFIFAKRIEALPDFINALFKIKTRSYDLNLAQFIHKNVDPTNRNESRLKDSNIEFYSRNLTEKKAQPQILTPFNLFRLPIPDGKMENGGVVIERRAQLINQIEVLQRMCSGELSHGLSSEPLFLEVQLNSFNLTKREQQDFPHFQFFKRVLPEGNIKLGQVIVERQALLPNILVPNFTLRSRSRSQYKIFSKNYQTVQFNNFITDKNRTLFPKNQLPLNLDIEVCSFNSPQQVREKQVARVLRKHTFEKRTVSPEMVGALRATLQGKYQIEQISLEFFEKVTQLSQLRNKRELKQHADIKGKLVNENLALLAKLKSYRTGKKIVRGNLTLTKMGVAFFPGHDPKLRVKKVITSQGLQLQETKKEESTVSMSCLISFVFSKLTTPNSPFYKKISTTQAKLSLVSFNLIKRTNIKENHMRIIAHA